MSESISDRRLWLKITSAAANLAPARHAVEDYCRRHGFDEQAVNDIGLALNEALANLMRHAYGGADDRPIEVIAQMQLADQEIGLSIRDWGVGRVPPEMVRRDACDLRPGGLGLLCMHRLMDDIRFEPKRDGGMLLTMTRGKRRSPAGAIDARSKQ